MTPERAVLALRHAVHAHGNDAMLLGLPGDSKEAAAAGARLGIRMPASYLHVLGQHDGGRIGLVLYGLAASADGYARHRPSWGSPPRPLWPVGEDGAGRLYVLAPGDGPEAPVALVHPDSGPGLLWVASSYAHFAAFAATRLCAKEDCAAVLRWPGEHAWPRDPEFVLGIDPDLERLQPRSAWPSSG